MDWNDYWQENKRFVTTLVVGLVVFGVGHQVLASRLGGSIRAEKAKITRLESEERKIVHGAGDLAEAQSENERLRAAVDTLSARVAFVPRPEFRLDPAAGSASNQYLRTLSRVREELLLLANRGDLVLDESLGMPKLSPTRDEEIERHLEALDAVDAIVRSAIDARVQRIDRIQLRLDPGLSARVGLGQIERTRLTFDFTGDGRALTAVLFRTQRSADGRLFAIDSAELTPLRTKEDEARLELTIVLPRLALDAAGEPEPRAEG